MLSEQAKAVCCQALGAGAGLAVSVALAWALIPSAPMAPEPIPESHSIALVDAPTPKTPVTEPAHAPSPAAPPPPTLAPMARQLPQLPSKRPIPLSTPVMDMPTSWDPHVPKLAALPKVGLPGSGPALMAAEPIPRSASPIETAAKPMRALDINWAYPPQARRRRIEGTSSAVVRVNAQGRVVAVESVTSDPRGVFETATKRAAMRIPYQPATRDGVPIPTRLRQRFRWELDR